MIGRLVHRIGTTVQGTALEEPLDKVYYEITGPRRTEVACGGLNAEFNARSSSEYYSVEELGDEAEIVEAMLNELSSDDIVWDIGAFVGWHAALFGQVSETIAFEADPDTFRKLQETCTLNPNARIIPVCLGLGDPPSARQKVGIADGEGGKIMAKGERGKSTTISSPRTLINTVFVSPTAVKLDVQGLEGQVIDGFGEYLADLRLLLIEFHEGRMTGDWTVKKLHERITDAGLEKRQELSRREDTLRLYLRP